jgi:hypothetical protein
MDAVYLFEAKGLQPYILEGGKLRDAVGASELVDRLCRSAGGDLLDDVLAAAGVGSGAVEFSRRAGGAFEMHAADRELLVRFRQLWQLAVQHYAPGLEYEDALTDLRANPGDALDAARHDPSKRAFRGGGAASLLPVAGPFVRRSQRTGTPAVGTTRFNEDVDRATQRKRKFSDRQDLAERFEPSEEAKPVNKRLWPTHFVEDDDPEDRSNPDKAFAFDTRDRTIAVVHIDGNGMGERLRELDRAVNGHADEIRKRRQFSEAIEQATQGAAGQATSDVLDTHALPAGSGRGRRMPARTIVLGGDDLTAIVRGDLAIPFVRTFLQAFEKLSAEKLKDAFPGVPELTEKMTACAGVVFIGATQPFYLAYDLASELCKHAKRELRPRDGSPTPSGLQFHRVTTSFVADWDSILRDDLRFYPKNGEEPIFLAKPYDLEGIATLEGLCGALRRLEGRGALREVWSLVRSDRPEAERAYGRWCDARSKSPDEGEALAGFIKHLKALTGRNPTQLFDSDETPLPLGDVLALIEAGYGRSESSKPALATAEAGR